MALRSSTWYSGDDRNSYMHRAWMRRGLPREAFDGERPHIAIANTASDLTPCNSHLNEVGKSVEQGMGRIPDLLDETDEGGIQTVGDLVAIVRRKLGV